MTVELDFFNKGIFLDQYMDEMTEKKEESFAVYEGFQCPQTASFYAQLQPKATKVLIITEDWCGDAMMNNPILRKIGELAHLDMRVAYRDADPTLIDRHLTNGGRSIPVYLLLDEAGEVVAKWGPRAQLVQQDVTERMAALPEQTAPDFEEKKKETIQQLTQAYVTNAKYWEAVHDELVALITK